MANNYVLGRGEIDFSRFIINTQTPEGFRYIGNTPEFNLTIESENLDHFNSDRGVNEKDASIVLTTNRTGSLITDNIDPENVALFFFGSKSVLSVTGATVTAEAINGVKKGLSYQLGVTTQNPVGTRSVTTVVVKDDATPTPTTYTVGTDYTVDLNHARITILEGGTIVDGTNLRIDYTQTAHTRDRILSGTTAVAGALRYTEYNAQGPNKVWYFPSVKLSPNGDYALKGDEWQQIPFSIEILKPTVGEAIYIDGAPIV